MHDVLLSYFGRALGLPLVARPWVIITLAAAPLILTGLRELRAVKLWIWLLFGGLVTGLAIGSVAISGGSAFDPSAVAKLGLTDLVTVTVAFVIGLIWAARQSVDARLTADILLAASAVHAVICLVALSGVASDIFPLIDSPYWRDGRWVSRPEITTDQTRQVLYLLPALCVVFVTPGVWRLALAAAVSAAAAYVTFRVQSRGSLLLIGLMVPLAAYLGVRYRIQKPAIAGVAAFAVALLLVSQVDRILAIAADTLWRFDQMEGSYGGRLVSNEYLLRVIWDPAFWMPRGYGEFFARYGNAPHSFPTMMYLMGGLLALACYLPLALLPLWKLGVRVVRSEASDVQRIAWFLGVMSLLVQLTQPVIGHEFFWLLYGLVAGSLMGRVHSGVREQRIPSVLVAEVTSLRGYPEPGRRDSWQ